MSNVLWLGVARVAVVGAVAMPCLLASCYAFVPLHNKDMKEHHRFSFLIIPSLFFSLTTNPTEVDQFFVLFFFQSALLLGVF